jgi:two-component system sensor histidine kinase DesK
LLEAAKVDADIDVAAGTLSREEEEVFAFALREAVTNLVRYAGATRCHVRLRASEAATVLDIDDDGKGMRAPEGGGLRGMRERISALGGSLDITSPGSGTKVTVTIPRAPVAAPAS